MKIGKRRFINRPSKQGKLYDRYFIYIPIFVAKIKDFPFENDSFIFRPAYRPYREDEDDGFMG